MKFEQVRIKNFRQYYGSQGPLKFSKSKEKNVTLIHGVNGAGKSNLFKAINWCIYGKDALGDLGQLTNKQVVAEIDSGETTTTEVSVSFRHQGETYHARRSISCKKLLDGEVSYEDEDFALMKTHASGKTTQEPNPVGIINSILPENVRTYFLFDGEKIDNFTKPESADDVRQAIYNILKLEILERGKKHLEEIASDYRSDLKNIAGTELQELLDKFDKEQKHKESLEGRIEELAGHIKSAEKKVKEIGEKLEGLKESKELQKERKELEDQQKERQKELSELQEEIRKIVTGPSNYLNRLAVNKALILLDSKRKKGEIPSNIREQFISDIIERKVCICDRHFEANSKEHKRLLELKNKGYSGALEEEVIELTSSLKALQADTETRSEDLRAKMGRKTNLTDTLDELDTKISEISQKLKDSGAEDVMKLEDKRKEYADDVKEYVAEKALKEDKLKKSKQDLKDLEDQIHKAKKDKSREAELSNKMTIAQNAANAIDSIYQQFADEMRAEIEATTKEVFSKLIWKEAQFKAIELSETYKLEVLDRWGKPASSELSAGERQVLSLAFITAMAKESGEEAPIVMDTPFGRLSSKHRERITRNLPELADQLILFITDEEMNEEMAKNLLPYVGETYELAFDDSTGSTSIEHQ